MASFMLPPVVSYVCSCGLVNPITKLYFCRHCLQLRCGFCVCHEVDSQFCSSCLENIPTSEAKLKKNRCNKCFNCPSCQHTLSARATTVVVPKKQEDGEPAGGEEADKDKVLTRKMYYLSCLACRWTSRDVGIPDQLVASGAWPESDYANQTRFNTLMEYYQSVVLQEKQEKADLWKRKTPKQHKYLSLTDRTGLTVSMIRRQMGWADKTPAKPKAITISAAESSDDVDELPESIFTENVNLINITTIRQRHSQPAEQPETVDNLFPQRKNLWIKRSLRCRQCEHNIIKPEYHPTSIKYRIQWFASYHVPEVRLVKCDDVLSAGVENFVTLKFTNPTMHDMVVTILDLPTDDEEAQLIEEVRRGFERQSSITSARSLPGLSRQASLTEEPRRVDKRISASMKFPNVSFNLNHRDDSAEFDEDTQIQQEEPPFVVWRKSNKASIKLSFTPDTNLKENDNVVIGFTMQYTYVNTVTNTAEKKDPQKHVLNARIYVKAGDIKSGSA